VVGTAVAAGAVVGADVEAAGAVATALDAGSDEMVAAEVWEADRSLPLHDTASRARPARRTA
jgi:hypothetical protein